MWQASNRYKRSIWIYAEGHISVVALVSLSVFFSIAVPVPEILKSRGYVKLYLHCILLLSFEELILQFQNIFILALSKICSTHQKAFVIHPFGSCYACFLVSTDISIPKRIHIMLSNWRFGLCRKLHRAIPHSLWNSSETCFNPRNKGAPCCCTYRASWGSPADPQTRH